MRIYYPRDHLNHEAINDLQKFIKINKEGLFYKTSDTKNLAIQKRKDKMCEFWKFETMRSLRVSILDRVIALYYTVNDN